MLQEDSRNVHRRTRVARVRVEGAIGLEVMGMSA